MMLKTLADQELLEKTKSLAEEERRISLEFLHHLAEISARKLHLQRGFSSLFSFLTEELKFSEGAAHRRIQSMKALRDLPEIEKPLPEGKVSLTTAAHLQTHFQEKAKTSEPYAELLGMLEQFKNLTAHSNPSPTYLELFKHLAQISLKKLSPDKKKTRTSAPNLGTHSRTIPAKIRREVWIRDQGSCQYQDPQTGRKCGSKFGVELEHRTPFSQGGQHSAQNLVCYCRHHNLWAAEKIFGSEVMGRYWKS